MNIQKAKKIINKINSLFDSAFQDVESVSAIEKELLKDYVRQFYDTLLDENLGVNFERKKAIPLEITPPQEVEVPKPKVEPQVFAKPTPQPKPVIREKVEPKPEIIHSAIETEPIVEEPYVRKNIYMPPPVPREQQMPTKVIPPTPPKSNNENDSLFEQKQATELSEKLSEMPISDLNIAMGVNERIFTINELFDSDMQVFQSTINTLNQLPDFEQAKLFLSENVANKYNWSSKAKQEKAKRFIKLVRRRYKN